MVYSKKGKENVLQPAESFTPESDTKTGTNWV